MRADCTIVTTCRGRRQFLEMTLPSWLLHTPCKILVVDDACPDGTADWALTQGDRMGVVRTNGGQYFQKSRALNLGLAAVETTFVMMVDADTLIGRAFWGWICPRLNSGTMVLGDPLVRDLTGFLAVETRALLDHPYDETMVGWAVEDLDVRARIYLSGSARRVLDVPPAMLAALPHDDALRVAHHEEKDPVRAATQNFQRMLNTLARVTGRPVTELPNDPVVVRLLGAGFCESLRKSADSRAT